MSGRYIVLPTPPSPSAGSSFFFSVTPGSDITDDLLKACADLFSTNYGVWGPSAGAFSKYTKPGQYHSHTGSSLPYYILCTESLHRATRQDEQQQATRPMRLYPRQDRPRDLLPNRPSRGQPTRRARVR